MSKDKEPTEALMGMAKQTAEQITGRTQEATENYFKWLQTTMSASPWGNTDLNKKLLSYATDNVSAAFEFVQRLSQAKNLEDVVKIQTEFMTAQMNLFNEHAKELGEIYAKVATAATQTPLMVLERQFV
jgi:phasin